MSEIIRNGLLNVCFKDCLFLYIVQALRQMIAEIIKETAKKLERESVRELVTMATKDDRKKRNLTDLCFEKDPPIIAMIMPVPRYPAVIEAGEKMRRRPSRIRVHASPGFSTICPVQVEYKPIKHMMSVLIVQKTHRIIIKVLCKDERRTENILKQKNKEYIPAEKYTNPFPVIYGFWTYNLSNV